MLSEPQRSPFLEEVRNAIRVKHYSIRTEQVYVDWVKRFILFHDRLHPKEMGGSEVRDFLTHLAVDRHVAASTQNQALEALVFLYKVVRQLPSVCTLASNRHPPACRAKFRGDAVTVVAQAQRRPPARALADIATCCPERTAVRLAAYAAGDYTDYYSLGDENDE